MKPLKPKKCKAADCGATFQPKSSLQRVCSPRCALSFAVVERKRKESRENRKRKQELKPKSKWLKEAQIEFNKFIRLRDKSEPCISCGRNHKGQYHAGHYRSVGAAPELRFSELNVHKQCAPCNNHKSGNVVDYRINLILKIGTGAVEWLEGPHEPKKYTIDEIKAIKILYREKCKQLEQA